MANESLDTLQLNITQTTEGVDAQIDRLAAALERLAAASNGLHFNTQAATEYARAIDRINSAAIRAARNIENLNNAGGTITPPQTTQSPVIDMSGYSFPTPTQTAAVDTSAITASSEATTTAARDFESATTAVTGFTTSISNLSTALSGVNTRLTNLSTRLGAVADNANRATGSISSLSQTTTSYGNAATRATSNSNHFGGALQETTRRQREYSRASETATKSTGKFFSSIKRIAVYRAFRTALRAITTAFKNGLDYMYEFSSTTDGKFKNSMDEIASSAKYLSNSLGAMLVPIINVVGPVLVSIMDTIGNIAQGIGQVIAKLTGQEWQSVDKYFVEYKESADAATSSVKEFKRQLLDFDELNVISSDSGSGGGSGSGSGSGSDKNGSTLPTSSFDFPLLAYPKKPTDDDGNGGGGGHGVTVTDFLGYVALGGLATALWKKQKEQQDKEKQPGYSPSPVPGLSPVPAPYGGLDYGFSAVMQAQDRAREGAGAANFAADAATRATTSAAKSTAAAAQTTTEALGFWDTLKMWFENTPAPALRQPMISPAANAAAPTVTISQGMKEAAAGGIVTALLGLLSFLFTGVPVFAEEPKKKPVTAGVGNVVGNIGKPKSTTSKTDPITAAGVGTLTSLTLKTKEYNSETKKAGTTATSTLGIVGKTASTIKDKLVEVGEKLKSGLVSSTTKASKSTQTLATNAATSAAKTQKAWTGTGNALVDVMNKTGTSGKTAFSTVNTSIGTTKTTASGLSAVLEGVGKINVTPDGIKNTKTGLDEIISKTKEAFVALFGLKNLTNKTTGTGLRNSALNMWNALMGATIPNKPSTLSFTPYAQPYAEGGFPAQGTLALIGERVGDTEILGNINGRTGVVGGNEVTGIATAVYDTGRSEAELLREQNNLLRQLIAKTGNIKLVPNSQAGKWVRQASDAYAKVTGV